MVANISHAKFTKHIHEVLHKPDHLAKLITSIAAPAFMTMALYALYFGATCAFAATAFFGVAFFVPLYFAVREKKPVAPPSELEILKKEKIQLTQSLAQISADAAKEAKTHATLVSDLNDQVVLLTTRLKELETEKAKLLNEASDFKKKSLDSANLKEELQKEIEELKQKIERHKKHRKKQT